MRLLIDTQVLAWLLSGDRRLRQRWIDLLAEPEATGLISAVIAWEYSDLRRRGRLPVDEDIADLIAIFGFAVIDFPADCWAMVSALPNIHRDPIDRMLVAHALAVDATLITSDADIRRYPVKSVW